jgi:hypothetical protein
MAQLRANFDLANGEPLFATGPQYRHYQVLLSIQDPPENALTIIYQLDSSYPNPVRMVTKGAPNFQEYITAYGDYVITVVYRPVDDPSKLETLLSARLSRALHDTYGSNTPPPVAEAIKYIEDH